MSFISHLHSLHQWLRILEFLSVLPEIQYCVLVSISFIGKTIRKHQRCILRVRYVILTVSSGDEFGVIILLL